MRLRAALLLLLLLPAVARPGDGPIERGDAAWRDGDLATALIEWTDALAAARDASDDGAIVEASIRLAAAHREAGRVDTAARALDLADAHARGDALTKARIATARGQIALRRGDVREAERTLALAYGEHQRLDDPAGAATAALSLGVARLARADLDGAWKAFTVASTLYEALGDAAGRADALTDLGITALRRGDLRTARDHLEAAVAAYHGLGDPLGEADAATNLGRVLQMLGRDDLAEARYESALAVARARKDLPRQGTLLANLGTLAHLRGDPEAVEWYTASETAWRTAGRPREALGVALNRAILQGGDPGALGKIRDEATAAREPGIAARASLGIATRLRRTDPKRAGEEARAALALADGTGDAALAWGARYVAGRVALDRGDLDEAVPLLRAAVDALERTRRDLADAEARSFTFGHADVYGALIDALLARGESATALLYAERLQQWDLPDAAPSPTEGLTAEQAWLEERLAGTDGSSEEAAALRERLAALRVEFAETVDQLRARDPDFDRRVRVAPEDLEAIQADLPPGVTVVQPVLLEDRLALLVFRRDRLVARIVDVPSADVADTIARLARSLRAGLVTRPEWTVEQADRLGDWLVDPIAGDLEGTEVLVVSATGPFRQLPFALVRADGKWLAERYAVVGVTHVGSLADRGASAFHVDGSSLLLVGNPDHTLAGADVEVKAIAEAMPGAQVLVGDAGTLAAVTEAARGKTVVHLATHGRIDPEQPDRSHLVLAGPDGRLAYREIPGLGPSLASCRMVVLSACESGLAVDAPAAAAEPLVSINGLAAQFRRAGVETLVASLWQVDDEATGALMTAFYRRLAAGEDIARALAGAQADVRATSTWSHPWYWAGFVVVGDWR